MQLGLELYHEQVEMAPGVTLSLLEFSAEHMLLFLHGFGGNAAQWRYQMEAFAEHNRVIAPNLCGHGHPGRPRNGFEMRSLVDDLQAIVAVRQVVETVVQLKAGAQLAWLEEETKGVPGDRR